jgi:hypothetical protein
MALYQFIVHNASFRQEHHTATLATLVSHPSMEHWYLRLFNPLETGSYILQEFQHGLGVSSYVSARLRNVSMAPHF